MLQYEAVLLRPGNLAATRNLKDFAGAAQLSLRIERPGPAWRAWQEGAT